MILRLQIIVLTIVISGQICSLNLDPLFGQPQPSAEVTAVPPQPPPIEQPTPSPQPYLLKAATATNGLVWLDSYRANLIVNFAGTSNGQTSTGHIESLREFNRLLKAQHHYLNVEGTIPDPNLVTGVSEFFQLQDQIYIIQPEQALSFVSPKTEQISSGQFGFLELESLMLLPEAVSTPPQLETLNGIKVQHYHFTQADLNSSNMVIKQARGEVWVADVGAYVFQYTLSATIKITTPLPNVPLMEEGTLKLSYILTNINSNVTIQPPRNLEITITPLAEIPRPADAQLIATFPTLLEYHTALSPVSATLFYQAYLPTQGWTEANIELFEEKSRLIYTNTQKVVTILIAPSNTPPQNKISLNLESP